VAVRTEGRIARRIATTTADGVGHTAQELMTLPRSTTSAPITKFGTTQHLNIVDTASDQRLGLTGSTGHDPEATGDKLVIHLLGVSAEA